MGACLARGRLHRADGRRARASWRPRTAAPGTPAAAASAATSRCRTSRSRTLPRPVRQVPPLLRAQGDARQVLVRLRRAARRLRHARRGVRGADAHPDGQDPGLPDRPPGDGVLAAAPRLPARDDGGGATLDAEDVDRILVTDSPEEAARHVRDVATAQFGVHYGPEPRARWWLFERRFKAVADASHPRAARRPGLRARPEHGKTRAPVAAATSSSASSACSKAYARSGGRSPPRPRARGAPRRPRACSPSCCAASSRRTGGARSRAAGQRSCEARGGHRAPGATASSAARRPAWQASAQIT